MNGKGGAPKGSQNALRHGLNALKVRVKVRGLLAIDKRTLAARGLLDWVDSLTADLGGKEALTTQQRSVIDLATRYKLYGDHVDAFLVEQESLVNKKRRTVIPVLRERIAIGDALLRCLQTLGLDRKARPVPDLQSYLAEKYSDTANTPQGETAGSDNAQ